MRDAYSDANSYGDRDSDINTDDMVLYPESGKVLLVGLGVVFKPEQVPYWDE